MPEIKTLSLYRGGKEIPLSWSRFVGGRESGGFWKPAPQGATVKSANSVVIPSTQTAKVIPAPPTSPGDLVVLILNVQKKETSATLPSGFTQVASQQAFAWLISRQLATRVATSSEPSSYSLGGLTGVGVIADVIVVSGHDPVKPRPVAVGYNHDNSITPNTPNGLLLASAASTTNQVTSLNPPAGMTELTDSKSRSPVLTASTAWRRGEGTASTGPLQFSSDDTGSFSAMHMLFFIPSLGS